MNVSILGTKAAGKGTQIRLLVDNLDLVYYSPGEMFRQAAKRRTSLGLLAEQVMNRGELVADDVVNGLVQEWLWTTSPNQSIIFDGFPRTLQQAEFLDLAFKDLQRDLDAVIYLEVSDDTVVERLSGRRSCGVCLDEFHVVSAPFTTCPHQKCQGEHLQPFDQDKPEAVLALVNAFKSDIQPILDFYGNRRKLLRVDGEGNADTVHDRLVKAILPFR